MTNPIAQLTKAKHILNLQFDDLQDLSNDIPANKALDKELHELIENKLDPIAFNKVFS